MDDEILKGYPISEFLQSEKCKAWNPETLRSYTNCLHALLAFTRTHGEPTRDLLDQWQQELQKTYARSGVNVHLAAVNNYFRWCDRYDLLRGHAKAQQGDGNPSPTLTRAEYLKLLRAARTLGKHRTYLLIKIFATANLPLQCLDQVTVDMIRQGNGMLKTRSGPISFYCPRGLQKELLDYAKLNGIYRGPVFVTRTGNPLERPNIFRSMQEVCRAAHVPDEKGNPRALRNLYKRTQQDLDLRMAALRQQMYDQMLDMEQQSIAWQPGGDRDRTA